jgi:hypothetical protein
MPRWSEPAKPTRESQRSQRVEVDLDVDHRGLLAVVAQQFADLGQGRAL